MNKFEKEYFKKLDKEIKLKNIKSEIINLKCMVKYEIFNNTITPNMSINPVSLLQMKNAYGINNIPKINNSELGIKSKVAIIIAGLIPTAQNDLDIYCSFYNLPKTKINLISLNNPIKINGWDVEACLDIQSIYTMALGCSIYLIQTKSDSFIDMMDGVKWCNDNNMDVVNMSWGSSEFPTQNQYNSYFSNKNIIYCASSGDSNYVNFPSILPNILSVGGSTLQVDNNNLRKTETTWFNAGSGVSKYTLKPSYQNNIDDIPINQKYRVNPDLSANANPSSGANIYCSSTGWITVGGTSLSSPINAGFYAIVNSGRKNLKKLPLNSVSNDKNDIHNIIYNCSKTKTYLTYFFDVIIGKDGIYDSNQNYDYATGIGISKFDNLYDLFVNKTK
jgi:Subtilase family